MSMTEQHQQDHHHNNDAPHISSKTTTRVCIKNVPLNYSEQKLTRHLLKNIPTLQITDCRILKTKDGKSRKLAFCGFKSPEMANRVVEQLNQTYAQTSKLTVELAFHKKEANEKQRPWSKHSVGSSRYQALHANDEKEAAKDHKESSDKDDEEKQKKDERMEQQKLEFLAAMGVAEPDGAEGSTGKRKFWSNDDVDMTEKEKLQHPDSDENDEELLSNSDSDDSASDVDSVDSGGKGADVMSRFETPKTMSDMDFMKSKVTPVDNLSDVEQDGAEKNGDESVSSTSSSSVASTSSSEGSDDDEDDDKLVAEDETNVTKSQQETTSQQGATEDTDSSVDPHRLFCRNLPFDCTEEELKEVCTTYGTVTECHLAVDDQRRNKGFAFVAFKEKASAAQALQELDGSDFQGRLLHVLPAKQRPVQQGESMTDDGAATTYKQKMELKRKQEASSSNVGANASFVRGDAIIDNLSERLGITKESILNLKDGLSSGDAAVRLALGETHIIQENRDYFAQHGVDMDGLVGLSKEQRDNKETRSTTAILVKNLPYDKTTLEDLTKMFHGVSGSQQQPPSRILLPPSRTIALVEYNHSVDARRAFQKLAYKRFKHVPLYLEWAPLLHKTKTSVTDDASKAPIESEANEVLQGKIAVSRVEPEEEEAHENPADAATSHTIFVKNLNFRTTEEGLRKVFDKHVSTIRAVRIPTKAAPVRKQGGIESATNKKMSMGYGFVECGSSQSVRKAIKALQGTLVNGHALELKPSSKQLAASPAAAKIGQKANSKLMVRNVPFQATRTEILKLFGAFGQLKKVRLPKKFNGTHRGYAFVEFTTGQEAQSAMKSLSRTHLYGRHLVLEWADDKEEVQEETKPQTSAVAPRQNKKTRFN